MRFVGNEVEEIQGEKNDTKIPQKYLDTCKFHRDALQFEMTENAENQINKAEKKREQIKIAKESLGSVLALKNINDVKTVLNYFNINAEINENNYKTCGGQK